VPAGCRAGPSICGLERRADRRAAVLHRRTHRPDRTWSPAPARKASGLPARDRARVPSRSDRSKASLVDIDPFDLLVHVAWNSPLATRRDRVNRLRREQRAFLQRFAPEAPAVLDAPLEKYADHGIDQLDDLAVLEVPPLTWHGSPLEIADWFGGPEQLRRAVERLGDLLCAA
jgi:hypothetical protein